MKEICRQGKDGIFCHILIERKEPAAECGENVFPTEMFVEDLIPLAGEGKKKGGPQEATDNKCKKGEP